MADAVYNLGMAAFHAQDLERAQRAFASALVQSRQLGERPYVAAAQLMLAEICLIEGDAQVAAMRAEESLDLYASLGDDRSRARCLVVLAGTAAAGGSFETAARLVGAAEAARGMDAPDEFERPVLERVLPELERRFDRPTWEHLLAEGRSGTEIVSIDAEA